MSTSLNDRQFIDYVELRAAIRSPLTASEVVRLYKMANETLPIELSDKIKYPLGPAEIAPLVRRIVRDGR